MTRIFNYIERPSPIHRLTGATKLVCMMVWGLAAMTTFDTRFLLASTVLAFALFWVSHIKLREVKVMLLLTLVLVLLNSLLIYLFAPEHGVELYGSRTVLLTLAGPYTITAQQLLYQANVLLKYAVTLPLVLLFVSTTDPSEFAASLNRLGISYKVSYSVSLALRYIPDIQKEYHDISQSQQARGIELSKKESLFRRLKNAAAILTPLILSSMDRIEVISNAMELRGFGKNKKRTWYRGRPFRPVDFVAMGFCVALLVLTLVLAQLNGGRFWNPFV